MKVNKSVDKVNTCCYNRVVVKSDYAKTLIQRKGDRKMKVCYYVDKNGRRFYSLDEIEDQIDFDIAMEFCDLLKNHPLPCDTACLDE